MGRYTDDQISEFFELASDEEVAEQLGMNQEEDGDEQ